MLRSRIVYLCGLDGSGKTTQMGLIAVRLRRQGVKYRYVWLRWAAFASYPIYGICRLLGYTKWKVNPRNGLKYDEHYFYKNEAISKVWTWLFTVDMAIYTFLRVKIPMKMGYLILCDRFVLDALVDIMYETKNYKISESLVGRMLLSLVPKKCAIIMLDISEEEAFKRKKDIPSVELLGNRRKLYSDLSCKLRLLTLNGSRRRFEIHEEIIKRLEM